MQTYDRTESQSVAVDWNDLVLPPTRITFRLDKANGTINGIKTTPDAQNLIESKISDSRAISKQNHRGNWVLV